MSAPPATLTLGTAGHIDHGKTALVRALTGVDTDRLPQEQARGMSIELGFAPLLLPGGRRVSVVDVPGHERFVRTMVAGATGIDLYLMVVAADDGVMPQTLEHAEVLAALGIEKGVVAITKCDRAAPERAAAEATELLPGTEVVVCSARTGEGVADVAAALERVASQAGGRCREGPAVLHVDRAFTIHGAGTVVTGTLWSGTLAVGDTPALLPAQRLVRVRSLQVHDQPAERAYAGQRVAVNLAGLALRDVGRGDALADPAAEVVPTQVVDAVLDLRDELRGRRVMVHHGTRAVPARLAALGAGLWQVRLEAPLLVAPGDRFVVRSVAPPDTLGGGTVLDPQARRHGRRPDVLARLERLRRGEPEPSLAALPAAAAPAGPSGPASAAPAAPALEPDAIELAERLLAAGHEPLSRSELGAAVAFLPALMQAGVAVRVGRDLYAHRDALAVVADRVGAIIADEGAVTLARLRDELGTSRKYAEALLEHLDSARYTKRLPDDRRVLRRRR